VYEYCLAIVAQKPIIAVLESDARFGGGPVDSFNLEGIFKHVLSHEIIEIHRTYWDAFIKYLHQRIEMTLKPNSAKLIKFGDKDVQPTNSKPHLEIENSQLSTDMSFVGGKDPLHGLIPKSQVSIEEKKKDVCESLGIKSYILEEEEMAFLENKLKKSAIGGGKLVKSSITGVNSYSTDKYPSLVIIESMDGRVFAELSYAVAMSASEIDDVDGWAFQFRRRFSKPKRIRLTIELRNQILAIGCTICITKNISVKLKQFERFEFKVMPDRPERKRILSLPSRMHL